MGLGWLRRRLGRRRSWLLLSQGVLVLGLAAMSMTDPAMDLERLVWLALVVAFASATQDIVIDAYRIESAEQRLQGILAAAYSFGYRLAMITASAGVLWIAAAVDVDEATYQHAPWAAAYAVMSGLMLIGVVTTLLAPEPAVPAEASSVSAPGATLWVRLGRWLQRAVVRPFVDFFQRFGWFALLVLLLIGSYRISDIVLGVITNVFYQDMGFTKEEVANVSKFFGVAMTLVGAAIGGTAVYRFGIMPVLLLGGLLAPATNLLFSLLAGIGHDFWWLVAVVGMDNLSAGLASAAFVAYLSSLTNVVYSATQYALFSSLMLLLPKFLGGFSGVLVEAWGYAGFFSFTALLGVPVLIVIVLAWRFSPPPETLAND
jgi:PAT family beta-lactamase induction signal transducer AmpG